MPGRVPSLYGFWSGQERINVTFRWIKQHVSSCPLLKAGVACCLPMCAQGSSVPATGNLGNGGFGAFLLLFGALCILGVPALLVYPLWCTRFGSRWCASCWTRPLGEGRWRHNTATYFHFASLKQGIFSKRASARTSERTEE